MRNDNRTPDKKKKGNADRKGNLMLIAGFCSGLALSLAAGNSFVFSVCCAMAFAAVFRYIPVFAEKRKKKRELKMYEIDMADYLIGVSLLMSSGMTVWESLRRALAGADLSKPLYRDIDMLFEGIDAGKYGDPVEAFEELASECGSPAVSTLTAAIVQNYKKGSGEIAALLRDLSLTARNNRKYICMKLADEATTLLLIPSTLILIALIVLLVAPAVMTLMEL